MIRKACELIEELRQAILDCSTREIWDLLDKADEIHWPDMPDIVHDAFANAVDHIDNHF